MSSAADRTHEALNFLMSLEAIEGESLKIGLKRVKGVMSARAPMKHRAQRPPVASVTSVALVLLCEPRRGKRSDATLARLGGMASGDGGGTDRL
jgi:hypothetical protein